MGFHEVITYEMVWQERAWCLGMGFIIALEHFNREKMNERADERVNEFMTAYSYNCSCTTGLFYRPNPRSHAFLLKPIRSSGVINDDSARSTNILALSRLGLSDLSLPPYTLLLPGFASRKVDRRVTRHATPPALGISPDFLRGVVGWLRSLGRCESDSIDGERCLVV